MQSQDELFAAIASNALAQVQAAIASGADPNAKDESGRSVLYHAIAPDTDLDVLKYLLQNGADVMAADWSGEPLLNAAAKFLTPAIVSLLIDAGAQPSGDALAATVWNDKVENALALLQHGCPVDEPQLSSGQTALHQAFVMASPTIAAALADAGADHTRTDNAGNTLLHLMAEAFVEPVHAPLVQLAIARGVDPHALNDAGKLATDLLVDPGHAQHFRSPRAN